MNKKKKIVLCLIIFFIIVSPTIQIFNMNLKGNSDEISNEDKFPLPSDLTSTKQWITNGGFDSPDNWTSIKGSLGDPTDVNAYISGGQANYEVVGSENRFTFEEKYNMGSSWVKSNHPDFPVDPSYGEIVAGEGFRAEHYWNDQNANQVPSVQWERNFSLPINMSDYVIKSSSVSAGVNATVDTNIDTVGDGIAGRTARTGGYYIDTYSVGDYIRFYVSISNLQKTKTHEIAYTQSATLGDGNAGSTSNLAQQFMSTVSQTDLIYYISSVLDTDYRNFTLIVGIRFNCEDNLALQFDLDDFDRAVINSINLTFAYEKTIDQLTSISYEQVGDRPNDLSSNTIVINEAILNFQYKINDTWPINSPNSEFRILINGIQHSETVKLSTAITTFKDAKTGGFDVTYLIDENKNVNLSLQVYLADQFDLNRIIKISIDNVYLNITYTEIIEDKITNYVLYLNNVNKTLDPVISLPLGESLNITIKYLDNQTGNHISGANVTLEGKVSGDLDENLALEQYYTIINTNDLGIGVKTLTVVAAKVDYETKNIPFFVEVTERDTELLLFLDGIPKNDGDTIQVKADEIINVTINYRDNITKQFLAGATVSLLGIGNLNETTEYYNITIDTDGLDKGITAFTVFAQLEDYMPQSVRFFVELIERETELLLFLDSVPKNDKDQIEVRIDEFINVTVYYNDDLTKQLLTGATVTLLGIDNLTETASHYSIILDTNSLSPGITVLTIFAQLNNYRAQSIQFFVDLVEKETELLLFLNGVPKNDKDKIDIQVDEIINVTIYYNDDVTKQLLTGATVTLLGVDNLTETASHYNIIIDINDLDPGITVLTVFAQLDNYKAKNIQFFVEIVEKDTELLLFLDSIPKNDGDKVQVEVNEFINVTVYYRDNITKQLLSGATIALIGRGDLTETSSHYNITIDTNDLDQGITVLTIFAQLDNYQPQSIQFFVEVVERESELELLLDGVPCFDPVIEVTIGNILNITIYYTDNQTGFHITGALVQLIGEGDTLNLTENLNQYSIYLNTSNLKIGVSLFTIVAHANNFQIRTIDLRITTNRIKITPSTDTGQPYITGLEGDTIKLIIILNNTNVLPFGELIKNATVTYKWAYGQGLLFEPENDGIYEADLVNVPSGTYIITITASAGDDYDFDSYEITLSVNVREGLDLTWLVIIFSSVIIGLLSIFGLYQKHFKYPPLVRKIRKLRKKVSKGKKIKPIGLSNRNEILRSSYNDQIKILDFEQKQFKKIEDFKNLEKSKEE
ncbi:MAG: hypothetical protein ACFE8M_11660 [Candidatus Hermodarchaeota archaeon]